MEGDAVVFHNESIDHPQLDDMFCITTRPAYPVEDVVVFVFVKYRVGHCPTASVDTERACPDISSVGVTTVPRAVAE